MMAKINFRNISWLKILDVIFAFLFIFGFNFYFFNDNLLGKHSVFNLILLFLVIYLFKTNRNVGLKKKKIPFIFGSIFTLALLIGHGIYYSNDIETIFNSNKSIIIFFVSFLGFSRVISEICFIVFRKLFEFDNSKFKMWPLFEKKYIFFLLWLLIFLSWVPFFLAYYPGILSYDSGFQIKQALGEVEYTMFHPPIHTFIFQMCYEIGSFINFEPVVLYGLLQMLFLSFVFAYLIKYLIYLKTNNWLILIAILFFTINPVISIFSFNMTKDVFFTGFFILFVLQLFKFIHEPSLSFKSVKRYIFFILTALLACLFRNNFIYVFIVLTVFLIVYFRKYIYKVLIFTLVPIILYFIITGLVFNMFGVEKGNEREKLSVPIQQLSLVYYKHSIDMDKKTQNNINKFIDGDLVYKKYNPRFADPMKDTFKTKYYNNHKGEFYKLWFDLLLKYPSDYISSFLTLNLPYWYPDADTVDFYAQRLYIETDIAGGGNSYPIKRESKFPWLLDKCSIISDYSFFSNKPIISNLFSISLPIWILLFTFSVLWFKKQKQYIIVLLPAILLWGTYMLGPVSNFRYVLPLFCMYPLLLVLMYGIRKR